MSRVGKLQQIAVACHGISWGFVASDGSARSLARLEDMMKKLVLCLCLMAPATMAAAEADYTKLRNDSRTHEELLAASKAYLVDENCDELALRRLYFITTALSLQSHARGLGYTNSEISAYVDSPKEQARFRAIAEPWLAKQGAKKGDKAGFCKVGRAEMEKGTLLGDLLKED